MNRRKADGQLKVTLSLMRHLEWLMRVLSRGLSQFVLLGWSRWAFLVGSVEEGGQVPSSPVEGGGEALFAKDYPFLP